jgi:hypothetical protein
MLMYANEGDLVGGAWWWAMRKGIEKWQKLVKMSKGVEKLR